MSLPTVFKTVGLKIQARRQRRLLAAPSDADWQVRRNACDAFGKPGTVLLSDRYSRSCRTEETWFEMLLAELWGGLGDCAAVEPLVKSLADKDYIIRQIPQCSFRR